MVAFTRDVVNNFDWISEPIRRYILNEAETIPEAEVRGLPNTRFIGQLSKTVTSELVKS